MQTISDNDLAMVTGGKTPDATTTIPGTGTSSPGSGNSAILGALHNIQGSLSNLKKPQGMFSGQNGMMLGLVAGLAMRNHGGNYSVSYNYGGGPAHARFSFRSYW